MRNRMREICTSGSVRGGGGNVPTYSAICERRSGSRGGDALVNRVAVALQDPGVAAEQPLRMLPAARPGA